MLKIKRVGKGTYGKVYKVDYDRGETVAIKRNFKDIDTTGISSIRELNMLALIKSHPLVTDLKYVTFDDPFEDNPQTPLPKKTEKTKDLNNSEDHAEDNIYFIMEYVEFTGTDFFSDKTRCTADVGKRLTCQLMLVMEFLHVLNITHRDIKPGNIMITYDEYRKPVLKIGDFGMSKMLCDACPSTPGVQTRWYRAPEICCGYPYYGQSSDMWAVGCVVFEIFGTTTFLRSDSHKDTDIINTIIENYPYNISSQVFDKIKKYDVKNRIINVKKDDRLSFIEQMEIPNKVKRDLLNKDKDNIINLSNFMDSLLAFDKSKRLTSSKSLSHVFLREYRDYIKEFKYQYPPTVRELPKIIIVKNKERTWMTNFAAEIYSDRKNLTWYTHRILFHSIDLFDRYMEWCYNKNLENERQFDRVTERNGLILNEQGTYIRFYFCLYFFHKYDSTMKVPDSWKEFVPCVMYSNDCAKQFIEFEKFIIETLTEYNIMRDGLLEVSDMYGILNEKDIKNLLKKYCEIEEWDDGSMRKMYRNFMGISEK